ncbi:MAG: EAL domain-containing protein [Campylobacterota bacterium]|nr:EAL domain-containing protein [Campylobacterota bacterium]
MHTLLKEQLKHLQIDSTVKSIDIKLFNRLMHEISNTYENNETLISQMEDKHTLLYTELQETYLHKEKEKKHESDARLIQTVFQEATEGIIIEDRDRNIIYANHAMGNILGISTDELVGKNSDYLSTMISKKTKYTIYDAMTTQGFWHGEVKISPPNAKKIYCWLTLDAIFNEKQELNNIVLMITDISEVYKSRNQLKYLASYDTLTNLPNRSLLFKQLKKSIASMQRKNIKGMLLFIDIDHFKEYNDNYGHQIGDKVLLCVAQKITSVCRHKDVLGRLSGDEFLLISEDVPNQHAVETIIHKIQNIFKEPQKISNLSLHISISMGIALYPRDATTPEALINAADQAMYSVKKQGRNHFAYYTQEMSRIENEYYFVLTSLKDAIYTGSFSLVYQPQFLLKNKHIKGVEVLLRCTHSRLSNIPISRLITIAEETGIIHELTHILLDKVCSQLHIWKRLNINIPKISINLSRRELHKENLVLTLHSHLSHYKIDPHDIELEITESALLHESVVVKENITRLQKLGHTFSIDDYGTGFSSLSNIKTFHFDKLKIDKSFIDNLSTNKDDQVIVSATIQMAKKLGLQIVAEGVETQAQAIVLTSFGCDLVQGFLYAKPLSKEGLEKLLLEEG